MILAFLLHVAFIVNSDKSIQWKGALIEVNSRRAERGLKPFIYSEELSRAAAGCAKLRAEYRIAGHTANDFAALPDGAIANAAGCGALDPSWGWQSCCTYDDYVYAGAAITVYGGIRYMHIFVSGGSGSGFPASNNTYARKRWRR